MLAVDISTGGCSSGGESDDDDTLRMTKPDGPWTSVQG